MSLAKGRPGYADAALKGGDAPPGDGFGGEIERMLMDRPMTRQSFSGSPAPISTSGPGNTLDELMAELGMLRGERGEVSLPDRQLGRNGTRNAPRMSATGDGSLLAGSTDGPLRPSTPRTNAATSAALAASGFVLPPAKGALPANPAAAATSSAGPLGPVRSQSPMSTRRSVTGAINGPSLGGTTSPVGCSAPAVPPPGVLERQVQLETRLEKMELREQQLMALVSQLQQQVSTLSRAQQATQQQLATVATAPPPAQPAVAASQPASVTLPTLAPPAEARQQSPNRAAADAPRPAAAAATAVSDEDYIQNDDGDSPTSSPRPRSDAAAAPSGPQMPPPQQQLQQQQSQRLSTPMPPATGAPGGGGGGGGRPNNKLVPGHTTPAEWELDVSQLRKELGALAANVVRLRDHMVTLVPGGPSPLSEELSAQAAAASQLKQNLTQIAMDVVSLHKGLTSLKHDTERNQTTLEKSINDLQLQIQTNALNMFAAGSPPGTSAGVANGHPNAVANALAVTGGVTGSLEESLRSAFAKPAMRALPAFNTAELGFMPDNAGAAAAVSAFGGLGAATGGGGGRNNHAPANGGGGGLGAALALLNSFEEQAAAEQAEQQKAAIIARQAVSIVDAKVKQVIIHVDRHMQMMSSDVEERLRMYEQTIIRMAQQIDRVQRALKDIEGTAVPRIVVRQGGKDVDEGTTGGDVAARKEPTVEEAPPTNWVKAAAMSTGRFVPQKLEERKPPNKNTAHGYFRTPP